MSSNQGGFGTLWTNVTLFTCMKWGGYGGSRRREKPGWTPACNFTEERRKNFNLALDGWLAWGHGIVFQISPILSLHKRQLPWRTGQVLTFLTYGQKPLLVGLLFSREMWSMSFTTFTLLEIQRSYMSIAGKAKCDQISKEDNAVSVTLFCYSHVGCSIIWDG